MLRDGHEAPSKGRSSRHHDCTTNPIIRLKDWWDHRTSTLNTRSFPICPESPGDMLRGCCDFLPSFPPRFVSFAWRYLGCTRLFRSSTAECTVEAWSWSPGISGRDCPRKRQDLPSSWGISIIRLHVFSPTPAGLLTPDHYGAAAWPPDPEVQRLPHLCLSTPNSMAFGLAVYASPGSLPHHDARLASGCWSGSTGWAFHPQDSAERFQICFLHLILLSQALLGAIGAT